jgi:hypothetical protein
LIKGARSRVHHAQQYWSEIEVVLAHRFACKRWSTFLTLSAVQGRPPWVRAVFAGWRGGIVPATADAAPVPALDLPVPLVRQQILDVILRLYAGH